MEPQRRRFIRSFVLLYATEFGLSDMPEPGIITPPPGIDHLHRKDQERKDHKTFKDKEYTFKHIKWSWHFNMHHRFQFRMKGTLQEPLDGSMHDATSERQSIQRQASERLLKNQMNHFRPTNEWAM